MLLLKTQSIPERAVPDGRVACTQYRMEKWNKDALMSNACWVNPTDLASIALGHVKKQIAVCFVR